MEDKELHNLEDLNAVKGFKVVHVNVRSILKKIDQVRLHMLDSKIDVFTVSETWMRPHLDSSLISIQGYKTFRLDRGKDNSKSKNKKRGGGLLTYVRESHADASESLPDLEISDKNIEAQWTLIHRPHCKNVLVCNVYRPPKGELEKAISYLENCIRSVNIGKVNVIVIGDLNVNYKNKKSPDFKKMHFFSQSNGLTQYIKNTTRNTDKSQSLIDLALSNSQYIDQAGTLDHFISDHQPIYIIHKKGRDRRSSVEFRGRSYRKFDSQIFRDSLVNLGWEDYKTINDPEEAWSLIHDRINLVVDEMCPIQTFHIKNYKPDWMSKELIEQMKDRDYFFRKAKSTGDADAWNIAKHLRNITNSNIRQAKRDFVLNELDAQAGNCKKFWKIIKSVVPSGKQDTKQEILLKNEDGIIPRDKVAHFVNDYFINIGKPQNDFVNAPLHTQQAVPDLSTLDGNLDLDDHGSGEPLWEFSKVSEQEVFRVVKQINTSKSSGLDDISSFIVKESFLTLLTQITHMFNLSIYNGKFPDSWKKALVIPIPKTGNLNLVKNYRPISLLPLPGKILEKLVHSQLSDRLEMEKMLSDNQHGFRKGHSTIHSVAQLINHINTKMDEGLPTVVTYIDFRKAFDCVQHPVLMKKIEALKMHQSVLGWVQSYLSDRQQRVLANDIYSSFQTITQGVPQGSVLGPLFYIIYANDLSKVIKNCKIAMYADDTVLYATKKCITDAVDSLQQDLTGLAAWCKCNGIKANTDKTKVMVFGSQPMLKNMPSFEITIDGTPLQTVTAYKYLGITLDSQLKYDKHINKVISNVSGKLKQFRRMRGFLSEKAAILVYKNMILPIIEYGDIFLSAASAANKRRLQTLQNKGLRCALNRGTETSTVDLHEEANLLMLKFRREQHTLNYMYDASLDPAMQKSKRIIGVKTRSQNKRLVKTKRPKTEKFRKSVTYLGPKRWNNLPETFHQIKSKDSYKVQVEKWVNAKSQKASHPLEFSRIHE